MPSSTKDSIIELVEIAECNLLFSLRGIQPDQIYLQAIPEFNHIAWIFGHCAVHLHWIIDLAYQEKRTYSDEVCHYYRYGTTKDEILKDGTPINFHDLVEKYLEISKSSFDYLKSIEDELLYTEFPDQPKESLLQNLYKVALHYMGHMGQIVLLRKALGNPGYSFVGGATEASRKQMMDKWKEWWVQERDGFRI